MELEDNVITVELTKSGKPRKRKPKTSHTYFTEDTQNAIVEYVESQDQKFRDKVYDIIHINLNKVLIIQVLKDYFINL